MQPSTMKVERINLFISLINSFACYNSDHHNKAISLHDREITSLPCYITVTYFIPSNFPIPQTIKQREKKMNLMETSNKGLKA